MATYDIDNLPSGYRPKTGDIINCPYKGSAKSLTLTKGTYKLEVWGAQGGYRSSSTYGGKGGYSVGTLSLSGSLTAYLLTGGSGNTGGTSGGFNGGGKRSSHNGGGGGSIVFGAGVSCKHAISDGNPHGWSICCSDYGAYFLFF